MPITTTSIFLNCHQHLNDWEKLSFSLFGDEEKEMNRFVEFNKEMFEEVMIPHIETREILDKSNYEFMNYLMYNVHVEDLIDQNTMMYINSLEHENGNIPFRIPLLRYKGNRIDFDHIWKNRHHYINVSITIKNYLFYSPCVFPNVLDSLSQESLVELAKERYDERYAAFITYFKKNDSFLEESLGEDITMIIIGYIQPPAFLT